MSRNSAYRLRRLPGAESFAAAWDEVLGAPVRKVTPRVRDFLEEPLVHLVMFRGRYRAGWWRPGGCDVQAWQIDTSAAPGHGDRVSLER